MGGHGMDMDMDMNVDMLLNKMCCRYLFSCEKNRETTGASSHFYALHQCFFPLPPPPLPQNHD